MWVYIDDLILWTYFHYGYLTADTDININMCRYRYKHVCQCVLSVDTCLWSVMILEQKNFIHTNISFPYAGIWFMYGLYLSLSLSIFCISVSVSLSLIPPPYTITNIFTCGNGPRKCQFTFFGSGRQFQVIIQQSFGALRLYNKPFREAMNSYVNLMNALPNCFTKTPPVYESQFFSPPIFRAYPALHFPHHLINMCH